MLIPHFGAYLAKTNGAARGCMKAILACRGSQDRVFLYWCRSKTALPVGAGTAIAGNADVDGMSAAVEKPMADLTSDFPLIYLGLQGSAARFKSMTNNMP